MDQTNSFETEWEGIVNEDGTVSKTKSDKSSSKGDGGLDSGDIKTSPYYDMSRMIGGSQDSITINKGTNY
nr:MAG TPA: hypothetical protein [Bacteriophage sp.]